MYRLLDFKSVSNARLLLNRRKLLESNNQNFHSLFNQKTNFLKLPGEWNELKVTVL